MNNTPLLKQKYHREIIPQLKKQLGYNSHMQVPKLKKITINQCLGAKATTKHLEQSIKELTLITGQKAVIVRSKKNISNFNLKKNVPIATKVTLRHKKMYIFARNLIDIYLPRIRNFRGINPNGFDKQGNYTLGIKEQIIFPEINIDKILKLEGMNITFTISCKKREQAKTLLRLMNFPFTDMHNPQ